MNALGSSVLARRARQCPFHESTKQFHSIEPLQEQNPTAMLTFGQSVPEPDTGTADSWQSENVTSVVICDEWHSTRASEAAVPAYYTGELQVMCVTLGRRVLKAAE